MIKYIQEKILDFYLDIIFARKPASKKLLGIAKREN